MPAPKRSSPSPRQQLDAFLDKYTPEIASLARRALANLRARYPSARELVYDNYNALAIGFGPSDRASEAVFSIALYPRWVSLFFLQARGLDDPDGLLKGAGTTARHIVLEPVEMLDDPRVRDLMEQAVRTAKIPFDPRGTPALVIKSVSARQRPRRPPPKKSKRLV
jgi:hypothetical protein